MFVGEEYFDGGWGLGGDLIVGKFGEEMLVCGFFCRFLDFR